MFEYILIAGVNDTDEQASELAKIARRLSAKINLIPTTPSKAWNGHAPRARGRKNFNRSCGSTVWSPPCAARRATTLLPPAVSYDCKRSEPNAQSGFQSDAD